MAWSGVAFALASPGAGGLGSRLSKYLHPLAGRPLVWHTLHAAAALDPAPASLVVVGGPELSPELFGDLPVEVHVAAHDDPELAERVAKEIEGGEVLALDAAAPCAADWLRRLMDAPPGLLLEDPRGRPLAAWLPAGRVGALLRSPQAFAAVGELVAPDARFVEPEGFVVESRHELSRASVRVRDRLVRSLMEGGATFLLPDTVLVDVDVRLGRDTVVYPNVVLEGQTTVGDETVIGPGCRIVDSWIGSGVELKGYNYLSHTSVRNRAILEPHVRRGFD
ncbi:MAG TPA: hypothetical protein VHG91_07290 [Longimicrobium sp.]|nr:hypothetical protein [Longimicrobium sp.]